MMIIIHTKGHIHSLIKQVPGYLSTTLRNSILPILLESCMCSSSVSTLILVNPPELTITLYFGFMFFSFFSFCLVFYTRNTHTRTLPKQYSDEYCLFFLNFIKLRNTVMHFSLTCFSNF